MDNKQARLELKRYLQNYDIENPRIALKVSHIYRVADMSKKVAEELKLSEEQIELAELIGLLHDIGRFEQVKRYDTFQDRVSVDHASLGVEILKENNFLKVFCEEEKYHDIILTAIQNHNKFKIDNSLEGEVLLQSKIIRDADKIDILNFLTFEKFETIYKRPDITDVPISKVMLDEFFKGKQVERSKQITYMDDWLSNITYIFDINFKASFKILKEKDYINKIIDRTKTPQMEEVRKFANEYILERA